jgi:hypothetical protein
LPVQDDNVAQVVAVTLVHEAVPAGASEHVRQTREFTTGTVDHSMRSLRIQTWAAELFEPGDIAVDDP